MLNLEHYEIPLNTFLFSRQKKVSGFAVMKSASPVGIFSLDSDMSYRKPYEMNRILETY